MGILQGHHIRNIGGGRDGWMALFARSRSVGGHELALFLAIILAGYASTPCRNRSIANLAPDLSQKSPRNLHQVVPQSSTWNICDVAVLIAVGRSGRGYTLPDRIAKRIVAGLGCDRSSGASCRALGRDAPLVGALGKRRPGKSGRDNESDDKPQFEGQHGSDLHLTTTWNDGNKSAVAGRFHSSSWYHGFLQSE